MSEPPKSQTASGGLEGTSPPLSGADSLRDAIERAFDYRGDVTITTADGRSFEGYIFDRRADADRPHLRMTLAGGGDVTIHYDQVTRLTFSGRDTAEGRSWDTWVKKYVEKKLKGEAANIEPEALD